MKTVIISAFLLINLAVNCHVTEGYKLFPEPNGQLEFTKDDVLVYTRIVEQDEVIYKALIISNTEDLHSFLLSRVVAAYNLSQEAGACALGVEQQAIIKLNENSVTAGTRLSETTRSLSELLLKAQTQEDMTAAFEKIIAEKIATSAFITQNSALIGRIYKEAYLAIVECMMAGTKSA